MQRATQLSRAIRLLVLRGQRLARLVNWGCEAEGTCTMNMSQGVLAVVLRCAVKCHVSVSEAAIRLSWVEAAARKARCVGVLAGDQHAVRGSPCRGAASDGVTYTKFSQDIAGELARWASYRDQGTLIGGGRGACPAALCRGLRGRRGGGIRERHRELRACLLTEALRIQCNDMQ